MDTHFFFLGIALCLVPAYSSRSLIDILSIDLAAEVSLERGISPRLQLKASPAACCCALLLAGILHTSIVHTTVHTTIRRVAQ